MVCCCGVRSVAYLGGRLLLSPPLLGLRCAVLCCGGGKATAALRSGNSDRSKVKLCLLGLGADDTSVVHRYSSAHLIVVCVYSTY